jgi:hypothetical protein
MGFHEMPTGMDASDRQPDPQHGGSVPYCEKLPSSSHIAAYSFSSLIESAL